MHERVELYEITVEQILITRFLYPRRSALISTFFPFPSNFLRRHCRNVFEGLGNVKNSWMINYVFG